MNPCLVSAITSEPRVRTTRFASLRITSIFSLSSSRAMRPSIFEIAF